MPEGYQDLIVWQKGKQLALDMYRITQRFPATETYGLSLQMRRAAVSVPSNIAEGKGRHSPKDLLRFLYQARGSLLELETQVSISHELGYLDKATLQQFVDASGEVGRLLNGLIKRFEVEVRGFPETCHPTPAT